MPWVCYWHVLVRDCQQASKQGYQDLTGFEIHRNGTDAGRRQAMLLIREASGERVALREPLERVK
jgi:hypothetical protein